MTPTSYKCTNCGKENPHSIWLHAHSQDKVKHTCECGQTHNIQNYQVTPYGTPRKKKP